MKTYSRLTIAFLLLILVVPQVGADEPPENGPYVEFYENGQKKVEATFKDGKPDGLWTEWYPDGEKKGEFHYKNGILDGLATRWYENGQKRWAGQYKNGIQLGHWTDWYQDGSKEGEGENKLDGSSTEVHWFPNGQKKSEGTGKYLEKHQRHGKHGRWTTWNDKGDKLAEIDFNENQIHGLVKTFYPSAAVKTEMEFSHGKPDGKSVTYDDSGEIISEKVFKDGIEVKSPE
jgi:antitoxin component YwqK of YwqJK toxin-antitoxin module